MTIPGLPFFTYKLAGDLASGAVALYSTRRLRMEYTGPCMDVRRDSDNQVTSVFYDANGSLSNSSKVATGATFSSWYGSSSVFVNAWHDQSGQLNDSFQFTNASQPLIVNTGTLRTINGKATVYFNGSTFLTATDSPSLDLDSTMSGLFIASFDNFSAVRSLLDKRGPASTYTGYTFYTSGSTDVSFQWNTSSMANASKVVSLSPATLYSLSYFATKGSSVDFWQKLTDLGSGALTATGSSVNTNPLWVGGHVDTPTFRHVGNISEFMLFNNVLTTAPRNAIINNQTSYFSL